MSNKSMSESGVLSSYITHGRRKTLPSIGELAGCHIHHTWQDVWDPHLSPSMSRDCVRWETD